MRFERRNYLATGLEDASFDVVWAVESVCYAFDKRDFLREAYRLLRPGGRLPLADFFSVNLDGRPRRDRRLMEKWTRSWAIREYAVTEEFERQMAEAGFPDVVVRDVTRSVDRSVRRLFFYYYPGLVYTYLQQVHEAGIVHKDVNPGNILVNLEEGTVDLIDFGISSRVELQAQHLGNPARLEGTLAYI